MLHGDLFSQVRTTYILAPHPDDELIRLSHYIAFAAARGDNIIVLQVTQGGATNVASKIGLTSNEVKRVRHLEQAAALGFLTNGTGIIVSLGLEDGETSHESVLAAIRPIIGRPRGGTELYVASWHHDRIDSEVGDKHNDHVACVLAGRTLADEGHIVRYARHPLGRQSGTAYRASGREQEVRLEAAVNAYRAIGHRSVPNSIRAVLTTPSRVTG